MPYRSSSFQSPRSFSCSASPATIDLGGGGSPPPPLRTGNKILCIPIHSSSLSFSPSETSISPSLKSTLQKSSAHAKAPRLVSGSDKCAHSSLYQSYSPRGVGPEGRTPHGYLPTWGRERPQACREPSKARERGARTATTHFLARKLSARVGRTP